jgi:hypothetical protein
MKTPREILLARHRAADPKLDARREEVTARLAAQRQAGTTPRDAQNRRFTWRDLIWPSPWALTSLAGAWVLIFALNLAADGGSGEATLARAPVVPAALVEMAAAERRLLMTSLLESPPPEPVSPSPESSRPRPRSEYKVERSGA